VTAQLAISVRGTDNDFNVSEKITGLMAMKVTTRSEGLHDEIKEVLQKLNILIYKLGGVITGGEPSMAKKNSGLCSLIAEDV
jgi:hypothetical protein